MTIAFLLAAGFCSMMIAVASKLRAIQKILDSNRITLKEQIMSSNLWGFLSICVMFGVSLSMLTVYLSHKKSMKELDIEAMKIKAGEAKE